MNLVALTTLASLLVACTSMSIDDISSLDMTSSSSSSSSLESSGEDDFGGFFGGATLSKEKAKAPKTLTIGTTPNTNRVVQVKKTLHPKTTKSMPSKSKQVKGSKKDEKVSVGKNERTETGPKKTAKGKKTRATKKKSPKKAEGNVSEQKIETTGSVSDVEVTRAVSVVMESVVEQDVRIETMKGEERGSDVATCNTSQNNDDIESQDKKVIAEEDAMSSVIIGSASEENDDIQDQTIVHTDSTEIVHVETFEYTTTEIPAAPTNTDPLTSSAPPASDKMNEDKSKSDEGKASSYSFLKSDGQKLAFILGMVMCTLLIPIIYHKYLQWKKASEKTTEGFRARGRPMKKYVVNFAHIKEEFRLPELLSLCELFSLQINFDKDAYDSQNPFLIVELEDDEAVKLILSRAILIREIMEWAAGPADSVEELQNFLRTSHAHFFDPWMRASFKFDIDTFGGKLSGPKKTEIINTFAFSGLEGEIRMHDPEVLFSLYVHSKEKKYYFGRTVGFSQRDLIERFNLKKRAYLGTTSFESELSLVMSNLAMIKPGHLVLDPFVGTGSFLYTTSAFGAYSIGSDIDGRQLRGNSDCSFYDNLKQYKVEKLVLGGLVQDISHHAFRDGLKFDAIVTDPPYGVRAGAKKIGGMDNSRPNQIPKDPLYRTTRYPKTVPYEINDLVKDLFDFGVKFLRPKGRLLFWYAVDHDDINFDPATMMPRDPRYRPVADCLQRCRDFDRWLVVAELL